MRAFNKSRLPAVQAPAVMAIPLLLLLSTLSLAAGEHLRTYAEHVRTYADYPLDLSRVSPRTHPCLAVRLVRLGALIL